MDDITKQSVIKPSRFKMAVYFFGSVFSVIYPFQKGVFIFYLAMADARGRFILTLKLRDASTSTRKARGWVGYLYIIPVLRCALRYLMA